MLYGKKQQSKYRNTRFIKFFMNNLFIAMKEKKKEIRNSALCDRSQNNLHRVRPCKIYTASL